MSTDDWIIPERFEDLTPFLIGTPRQFYTSGHEIFCLREHSDPQQHPCTGCPHIAECEFKETKVQNHPIPHARRGIGLEEEPFFVLQEIKKLPPHLEPYPDYYTGYDEANLHWLVPDWDQTPLKAMKGQFRWHGTEAEFYASPYTEYYTIFDTYIPDQSVISIDYSAIEPRISTVTSREPKWMDAFKGIPKVLYKRVEFSEQPKHTPEHGLQGGVEYIHITETGETYCYRLGELGDIHKSEYESQCAKCLNKAFCRTVQDFYKNVPKDWHGTNRDALYIDRVSQLYAMEDKEKAAREFKDLRDISKIVGLAILYGGTAWTVSSNMKSSIEEADARIGNFLRELPTLGTYMANQRKNVKINGYVVNLFGRIRDVSRFSHSTNPDRKQRLKDMGYAERTALNHPIQSTAAEIIKIGMIRVAQLIRNQKWNFLAGQTLPLHLELSPRLYEKLVFYMVSSVHDEIPYILRDGFRDEVLPQVYTAMQMQDVMTGLGGTFTFESDVEFDLTRSWTSKIKYASAKVYLVNYLRSRGNLTQSHQDLPPNMVIIANENFDQLTLDTLLCYTADLKEGKREPPTEGYTVAVKHGVTLYLYPDQVPIDLVRSWARPMSLARIS